MRVLGIPLTLLLAQVVSGCGDDSEPVPSEEELASALLQPSDLPHALEQNTTPEFADRISLCMPTGEDPTASAAVEYRSADGEIVIGHGVYAYEDDESAEQAFEQIVNSLQACEQTSDLEVPELGDESQGLEVIARESGVTILEGFVLREDTVLFVATVGLTDDQVVDLLELADERLAATLENRD